jgi:hypothetical protein
VVLAPTLARFTSNAHYTQCSGLVRLALIVVDQVFLIGNEAGLVAIMSMFRKPQAIHFPGWIEGNTLFSIVVTSAAC